MKNQTLNREPTASEVFLQFRPWQFLTMFVVGLATAMLFLVLMIKNVHVNLSAYDYAKALTLGLMNAFSTAFLFHGGLVKRWQGDTRFLSRFMPTKWMQVISCFLVSACILACFAIYIYKSDAKMEEKWLQQIQQQEKEIK